MPIPTKPTNATTPSSNWWTYQADLPRTGTYPGTAPSIPLKEAWQTNLHSSGHDAYWTNPPVFGHDKVIVSAGLNPGSVYALSTRDGSIIWSFTAPTSGNLKAHIRGAPAAANNTIYGAFEVIHTSGPMTGRVCALRETDGSVAWQTDLPSPATGSVLVAYGLVFVQTYGQKIYALNQTNGTIVWSNDLPETTEVYNSPTVVSSNLVVAGMRSVYSLNITNGIQRWRYDSINELFPASPAVYYPTSGSGTKISIITAGVVRNDSTSPHDDIVSVVALSSTTGRIIWAFDQYLDFTNNSSFIGLAEGKVFVLAGSRVVALSAANGMFYWAHTAPARIECAPAICNGILYFTAIDNKLHAVNLHSAQEVFSSNLPGNYQSSDHGIAVDQKLIVIPNSGKVIAYTSVE